MCARVEVAKASLFDTPSPILTYVSILDMFTVMYGVQTSFIWDSVCETLGGMIVVFLGMDVDG